jgi:acyl-CoA thioester hydrolase
VAQDAAGDGLNGRAAVPSALDPSARISGGLAEAGRGLRYVCMCPLRWGDMDSFGHVNNVVYLRYLEQARVEWMFTTAKEAGVGEFSLGTVVARHQIEYRRPLVYRPEPVRVESWVTQIRNASFTVAYEVRDDEWVYAVAQTDLVPYDLAESRPRRITDKERDYLRPYLAPASPNSRTR